MKFFKLLHQRREADRAAIQNSEALLNEAVRTEPDDEGMRDLAYRLHRKASDQAQRLQAADHQNHYSESLTHAFRGNPA